MDRTAAAFLNFLPWQVRGHGLTRSRSCRTPLSLCWRLLRCRRGLTAGCCRRCPLPDAPTVSPAVVPVLLATLVVPVEPARLLPFASTDDLGLKDEIHGEDLDVRVGRQCDALERLPGQDGKLYPYTSMVRMSKPLFWLSLR